MGVNRFRREEATEQKSGPREFREGDPGGGTTLKNKILLLCVSARPWGAEGSLTLRFLSFNHLDFPEIQDS